MNKSLVTSRAVEFGMLRRTIAEGFDKGTLESISNACKEVLDRLARRTGLRTVVVYGTIARASRKIVFKNELLEEALEASRKSEGDRKNHGIRVLKLRYIRTIIKTSEEFIRGDMSENDHIMKVALDAASRVFHERTDNTLSGMEEALISGIRNAIKEPANAYKKVTNGTSKKKIGLRLDKTTVTVVTVSHEKKARDPSTGVDELDRIAKKAAGDHDVEMLHDILENTSTGTKTITFLLESEMIKDYKSLKTAALSHRNAPQRT